MPIDPDIGRSSRPRRARWAVIAATVTVALLALYTVLPLVVGGASAEERRLIESAWDAEVASAAALDGIPGEAWEGSDLQKAAQAYESEGVDPFFLAIGTGESCPLPTGSAAAMEFMMIANGDVADRGLEEVLGVLRLTRRMERRAPDLVTLLVAAAVGDTALAFLLVSSGGGASLAGLSAPDPEDLYRAFCREQVALHAELEAPEAAGVRGEHLELTLLGLKVAGVHEARRLRAALGGERSPQGVGSLEEASGPAPGRLAVWRALWLLRPEELSEAVYLPLISRPLAGSIRAWQAHLDQWASASSGR